MMRYLPDKRPMICRWCSAASFATWPEECKLHRSGSGWTRVPWPEPESSRPPSCPPCPCRRHPSCSASEKDSSRRKPHLSDGASADLLCFGPQRENLGPAIPFPATTGAIPRTRRSRCRTSRSCCCFPTKTSKASLTLTMMIRNKFPSKFNFKNDFRWKTFFHSIQKKKRKTGWPTEKQTTLGSSET